MNKVWMLLGTMTLALLLISGCGSNEKETKAEPKESATEEKKEAKKQENEESKEEAGETATAETKSGDFKELISYMQEETEGTAKVIYENKEPQLHKSEGVTVSLDAYSLVELTDFHTDFSIPFNDETNGGVIIAQYTVKNELDKEVYYMPSFYLSFTGAKKDHNNFRDLLPEESQLISKLSPTTDYVLKAGESVTGYYAYPFGQEALQTVLAATTASVEVPAAQAVKGDFGNPIGKEGQFTLSLNEAGAQKIAANATFYQDKATVDDMGEKKMVKEENGIGKSEQLRDVAVTLDGYQFTEFTPNAEEAPRFRNFKNGIVLLTVKFNLDNKGSDSIGLSSMSSKLTVNDGTQYMLSTGMLLNYGYNDLIAAGESGEVLQIFVLDKEQYDKIWKDKSFELEIGPFRDQEGKDISKGNKVAFKF